MALDPLDILDYAQLFHLFLTYALNLLVDKLTVALVENPPTASEHNYFLVTGHSDSSHSKAEVMFDHQRV